MRKGLFVLDQDVSGINDYMFASLRACGWDVRAWNVGLMRLPRYLLAIKSFHWSRAAWRWRYHAALGAYRGSRKGLLQRTALCSRIVCERAHADDLILTFGTLFSPEHLGCQRPFVVFKDYTMALARRTYRSAIPIRTDADLEYFMAAEASACRHAALVLTASENTRRSIVDDYGVGPERVVVVGEGVCFEAIPPFREVSNDRREILFVGKDFERKGGMVLLEAFREVRRRLPDAHLTVIGPERTPLKIEGVDWIGRVEDRGELRGYFERSSVFAMPSLCEPFGLVFLEAMAYGLPCIGSNRDAMPEIIVDGETGVLVEPGNPADLAEKIGFLLEDPEVGRRMGRQGYRRLCSRFLWPHVAQRMDESLCRLL